MSVYKARNSPYFHYDFQIGGHRFHGSTRCTSRREAEAAERAERDKAQVAVKSASPGSPLTLDLAFARFWTEVAQHYAKADSALSDFNRLIGWFGKDTRLVDITDDDMAKAVAWRRGHYARPPRGEDPGRLVSAATVNRSVLEPMRALFRRAERAWKMRFDNKPTWSEHVLAEPRERVRELHDDEARLIEDAIRGDYEPYFEYVRASGQRMNECILRWSEVNWAAGQIVRSGKGGRLIVAAITPTIRSILLPLRGHHPEWVFTYVARRTRDGRLKGRRYPITYNGVKTRWRRDRKASGVKDFRFHDFRHDLGTKLLRETRNLKLVQKALNHASIETTTRYAHVLDDEVAGGLERVSESRKKSRRAYRQTG